MESIFSVRKLMAVRTPCWDSTTVDSLDPEEAWAVTKESILFSRAANLSSIAAQRAMREAADLRRSRSEVEAVPTGAAG